MAAVNFGLLARLLGISFSGHHQLFVSPRSSSAYLLLISVLTSKVNTALRQRVAANKPVDTNQTLSTSTSRDSFAVKKSIDFAALA